ncbi:MarR family winged helix-turn-helix transcriptional regulator [Amycolatopsis sp. H20-H5]|uniref:MarR family winged helix-turn-helix transcriptional regulator n=1 Tax=Amycolatopsis sp. H20-H5 TaxID=3046309 RepID=UPI002DBE9CA1|nr:MarR family transcriptional regulator [Amycolatopsis sp. H20-H5]MEC3979093.1 MarR family transcriptional regulator [Amycolatopsis sp. H20-H5]
MVVPIHVAETAGRLRGIVGQLHRRLRQVDNAGVLTPSQSAVLNRLDRDGPATQAELAAGEHVRQQSMGATLGVLDSLGLLRRSTDPADGRRIVIALSELGERTVRGVNQHREEWLATALHSTLSADELETIREALPLLQRLGQL